MIEICFSDRAKSAHSPRQFPGKKRSCRSSGGRQRCRAGGKAQGFQHTHGDKAWLPAGAKRASPALSRRHRTGAAPHQPRLRHSRAAPAGQGHTLHKASAATPSLPRPIPLPGSAATALPIEHVILCFFITLIKGLYSYYRN